MRRLLSASFALAISCCVSINLSAASLQEETQKALETLVAGHKASDIAARDRGVRMLEVVARKGSGDASFSLAAYYSGVLSPDLPKDLDKQCYWAEIAANQKHVEAYSTMVSCAMRNAPQSQKAITFEQKGMPWIRKMAVESRDQEEIAFAQKTIQEWDDAKRARQPLTLGGVLAAIGQIGTADTGRSVDAQKPSTGVNRAAIPTEKSYVCTIYCNTASGPTIRHELTAKSRIEAATSAGEIADNLCRDKGYSKASSLTLPERQCRAS